MSIRKEFEIWATEEGYNICRDTSNQYRNVSTRAAWEVWQARQEEIILLEEQIEELKELAEDDQPLPEDDEIKAFRPKTTNGNDLYSEAMRLVGAKRSKSAIIDLVHWLLVKANKVENTRPKTTLHVFGKGEVGV